MTIAATAAIHLTVTNVGVAIAPLTDETITTMNLTARFTVRATTLTALIATNTLI